MSVAASAGATTLEVATDKILINSYSAIGEISLLVP